MQPIFRVYREEPHYEFVDYYNKNSKGKYDIDSINREKVLLGNSISYCRSRKVEKQKTGRSLSTHQRVESLKPKFR